MDITSIFWFSDYLHPKTCKSIKMLRSKNCLIIKVLFIIERMGTKPNCQYERRFLQIERKYSTMSIMNALCSPIENVHPRFFNFS